jgi:hypothetical protein
MSKFKIARVLRWFDKTSDWLVGEEALSRVGVDALRELFEAAHADPMIGVYPIGPKEAEVLQPQIDHLIDRDQFVYFVEATQLEDEG